MITICPRQHVSCLFLICWSTALENTPITMPVPSLWESLQRQEIAGMRLVRCHSPLCLGAPYQIHMLFSWLLPETEQLSPAFTNDQGKWTAAWNTAVTTSSVGQPAARHPHWVSQEGALQLLLPLVYLIRYMPEEGRKMPPVLQETQDHNPAIFLYIFFVLGSTFFPWFWISTPNTTSPMPGNWHDLLWWSSEYLRI